MRRLTGRVAIVTGSGRGIGGQVARKLADDGASVVINGFDPEQASKTAADIVASGGEATVQAGDVTEAGFAERLVNTAVETYGGLHIIVNNAGYTWDNVIQKTTDEQWQTMLDVHLTAPFRLLRAAQPVISADVKRERESGTLMCRKVVNISSVAGLVGNPGQVGYAAAKAGVSGLTNTLAREWGRYNVTVNTVAFGLIRTRLTVNAADPQACIEVSGRKIKVGMNPDLLARLEKSIPLGRAGTPEDAAGAIYLLCIPESDYITGQTLVCGGGLML